jgi:hypothetical protein
MLLEITDHNGELTEAARNYFPKEFTFKSHVSRANNVPSDAPLVSSQHNTSDQAHVIVYVQDQHLEPRHQEPSDNFNTVLQKLMVEALVHQSVPLWCPM